MHVTKYSRRNHGVFEGKETTTKNIKVVRHYVQKVCFMKKKKEFALYT